jgi:flavin-dependent dehydrogenase
VYVTPQGERAANIAVLAEERLVARHRSPAALHAHALASSPEMARRTRDARLVDSPRIWGPLGLNVERACGPGWMLAGDAAGALDPITGEGVALALVAARELGRQAAARGPDLQACRAAVDARRRMAQELELLTGALLWLSRSPRLREGAVRLAGKFPGLFSRVLGVAAGLPPR